MKRIVIHFRGGAFDGLALDSHSANGASMAAACECYATTSHCKTGKRFGIAWNDQSCIVSPASMASHFGVGVYEIKRCNSSESRLDAFAEPVADPTG